jgi:hypothetical protein
MIQEDLTYSIYGKNVTGRPVVVECKPDATCDGQIHLSHDADVFEAKVYKVLAPTGGDGYAIQGQDLYTSNICGYTGYQSDIVFSLVPSAIDAPTGALSGDLYGLKFIASETGIFGTKAVADVIVKIKADLEI